MSACIAVPVGTAANGQRPKAVRKAPHIGARLQLTRCLRCPAMTAGRSSAGRLTRSANSIGARRIRVEVRAQDGAESSANLQAVPRSPLEVVGAVFKGVLGLLNQASGGLASPSPTALMASAVLLPMGDFQAGCIACLQNQVFMTGYFAWLFAQLLKVPTHFIATGVWRLRAMVDSGGMPSSHSSLCMGVTTAVAVKHGLESSMFPVCLAFSLIVMYDAAGVRRHAGKQAQVINKIVQSMGEAWETGKMDTKPLKEVLGHTPVQVFAGAVLGIVVGIMYSRLFC